MFTSQSFFANCGKGRASVSTSEGRSGREAAEDRCMVEGEMECEDQTQPPSNLESLTDGRAALCSAFYFVCEKESCDPYLYL